MNSVLNFIAFMQQQRYVFTFTEPDDESVTKTFGVWAKKHNQARSRVYNYMIYLGYEVSENSRLEGKPSNKPADVELPEEEISVQNA